MKDKKETDPWSRSLDFLLLVGQKRVNKLKWSQTLSQLKTEIDFLQKNVK